MQSFGNTFVSLFIVMGFDLLFLAPLILGLAGLASISPAAFAIFKRDFLAYFTNTTGYVFLCLFVALCGITAFWSESFF